jgi:hypothetical protein
VWQILSGGTEIVHTQTCITSSSRDIEKRGTQEIYFNLLRQQVIVTLASHFWVPTQSISHYIILTRDVRNFRHLKLTKNSKPTLSNRCQIGLTEYPSKTAMVSAYRERHTQELISKM